jgi:hypothetical protein
VIPSTFAGATRSTIVASGRGSHEDHHVDGEDLRRAPLELRKARLRGLLQLGHPGIAFNTHYIDGAIVFKKNACALAPCQSASARHIVPVARLNG